MRYTQALLIILVILLTGPAFAAVPGFVDLEFINIPDDADEIQDIDLGPVLKDVVRDAKARSSKVLIAPSSFMCLAAI